MNFGRTIREMHRHVRRETDAGTIDLAEDELFSILADSRRRFVVERLVDDEADPPTCSELAVEIAADETHMDPDLVPVRRVEPVEDDLRAEHLPRLADAGLVHWEGGAEPVRPGHSVEAVAALLDDVGRRVRRESALPFSSWRAGRSSDTPVTTSRPRS